MNYAVRLYFADEIIILPLSKMNKLFQDNEALFTATVRGASVVCSIKSGDNGELLSASVTGDSPLLLKRIDFPVFSLSPKAATDRILFFGNNMCHCTHRYPSELGEGVEYAADCTGLFEDLVSLGMAMAMVAPFTNTVGAGAVRRGDSYEFFAKTEFTEGKRTECELSSESVFLSERITIEKLQSIYRKLLPKSSFPMPRLTGWNTWDYYLNRITPEDIFENIEALKNMPFADKLNYIVIDDGWQKEWGEWVENEKFACGLDTVAQRIKDCGFIPGIWASPLLMKECCEGFAEKKHWFCLDESGKFIRSEGNTCLIDPTVPDAREFILDIYRRLYACGYRLFKIDYLSPLLKVKKFHDSSATPYSALRSLIKDVKAVTGEDTVILGCSLPVQCGADIAPSMRIGVDIHNHFSHVKWIAEILSWTWMYNNRCTRIDPDFLVVRGIETANEPLIWEGAPNYTAPKRMAEMTDTELFRSRWRQGDQFNAIEAETWAYLVAISGGNIFLSDKMSVLNERGISIIQKAFVAGSEECRPVYLEDDEKLPSVWETDDKMLIVNWQDIPARKSMGLAWKIPSSDKPFSYYKDVLTVTLLPHESILIKLEPCKH